MARMRSYQRWQNKEEADQDIEMIKHFAGTVKPLEGPRNMKRTRQEENDMVSVLFSYVHACAGYRGTLKSHRLVQPNSHLIRNDEHAVVKATKKAVVY
jgi:hypothetical protein